MLYHAGCGPAGTAWVAIQGEERDTQRFWLSVLAALRENRAGGSWYDR